MKSNIDEVTKLVSTLVVAYPLADISGETSDAYITYLAKIDLVDLIPAIDFIIENNPRFPAISEIRKCAMDYKARRITEENNMKAAKQREEEKNNRYVPTAEEWAQLRANLKKGVINVNDSQD